MSHAASSRPVVRAAELHSRLWISACLLLRCSFRDIMAVAAGHSHSAALGSDGTVWTWGSGRLGQLGHEVIADFMAANNDPLVTLPVPQALCSLDPAKLLPDHRCAPHRPAAFKGGSPLARSASFCCGLGPAKVNRCPDGRHCPILHDTLRAVEVILEISGAYRVTAISAGGDHTLVLTVGGSLLAFGCNKHGCLGLGDTCKRTIATQVRQPLLPSKHGMVHQQPELLSQRPSTSPTSRHIIHDCSIGQLPEALCVVSPVLVG